MIHDFRFTLHGGGLVRCDPFWRMAGPPFDQCYKCYLPTRGEGFLHDAGGRHVLAPGRVYLVSGYRLRRQECPRLTEHYWLHFNPVSFHLHQWLGRIPFIVSWPEAVLGAMAGTLRRVPEMFVNPMIRPRDIADNHPRPDPGLALDCQLRGVLAWLVGDALERHAAEAAVAPSPALERLRPAIDHMDVHFCSNPPLARLAGLAAMAPNYFHRLFRAEVGDTPFTYMEVKRLDQALRMLGHSALGIKQVAKACGYRDPVYFTRAFGRRFGLTPSEARRRALAGDAANNIPPSGFGRA